MTTTRRSYRSTHAHADDSVCVRGHHRYSRVGFGHPRSTDSRSRYVFSLLLRAGGSSVTALGSTYHQKTDGVQVAHAYSLMEEEFWGETTPCTRTLAPRRRSTC